MDKLPAAVQAAIKKEAAGARIRGLAVETENGKTLYEAELEVNGHTKDVSFDPAGRLVVAEEEVPMASIPAPARDAILKAAGKNKVTLVERVTESDTVAFEGHFRSGLKSAEVKVDAQGTPVR